MKRIIVVALFAVLSSACATSMLDGIASVKQKDLEQAMAILSDDLVQEKSSAQCVLFIANARPMVQRILAYPTSGPFSKVAKKRALETLRVKLEPAFEQACAPVLMDEKLRAVRFAALFGR